MQFRNVLETYGPKQISFFSDACQTLVAHDTKASPNVDEDVGEVRGTPKFDIYRATIKGEAAFATQADGPLFSKTVLRLLSEPPPTEALDQQYLKHAQCVVSSQSLADYVKANLPDYAATAGRKQFHEIATGFRFDTNNYRTFHWADRKELEKSGQPALSSFLNDAAIKEMGPEEFIRKANLSSPPRVRNNLDDTRRATMSEWRQDFGAVRSRWQMRPAPMHSLLSVFA